MEIAHLLAVNCKFDIIIDKTMEYLRYGELSRIGAL